MILFDPFYGVFRGGKIVAKWLNRALILAEVSYVAACVVKVRKMGLDLEIWEWLALFVITIVAIHIVNLIIRFLWNIVVVFRFGTTDAQTIIEQRREYENRVVSGKKFITNTAGRRFLPKEASAEVSPAVVNDPVRNGLEESLGLTDID